MHEVCGVAGDATGAYSVVARACLTGRVTDPAPDGNVTRMAQHGVPPKWVKVRLTSAPIEAIRERGTKCAFDESSPPSSPRQLYAGLGLAGAATATAASLTPGECEQGGGTVNWANNACRGGMYDGQMVD